MPAFRAALNRGTAPDAIARLATYHRSQEAPNEFSDIFIPFEAHNFEADEEHGRCTLAEADLLDEPGLENVRDAVANLAQQRGIRRGILWITNVGLSDVA